MIDIKDPIIIGEKTYTKHIAYFLSTYPSLVFIGYVDILDNEACVYHENLTQRQYDGFETLTAEEKTYAVVTEVNNLIYDQFVNEDLSIDYILKQSIKDIIRQREDAVAKGYMDAISFMQPVINDVEVLRNHLLTGMDNKCQEVIEAGFISSALGEPHRYRYNRKEDQVNFLQQIRLLDYDPAITTVYWKTEDVGVLPHSREAFMQIALVDSAYHKQTNIARYWQIKARILAATTLEELNLISWDMVL